MKLNLDFYQEKEEKISNNEKEIIENYINKYDENDYEKYFAEKTSEEELYYLTTSSQNILNWYPFSKEDSVLEIGGDLGQVTQVFTEKCKEVVTIEPNLIKANAIAKRFEKEENIEIIVSNIENLKIDKKFKYITLIGIDTKISEIYKTDGKLNKLIKTLEKYLDNDGKVLIGVDNKFGLRYFSGNPDNVINKKFQSLIGFNNETRKIETYTKLNLSKKIENIGYKVNFYYPLPDYRMPNVIFSDSYLPKYNNIDKYNPYYKENSTVVFNEIDVFREILKENDNMFTFFTNSFLIELSKEISPIKYKYISFNNIRKQKYRLITKITDEYAEKQLVSNNSIEHYNNIIKNNKILENEEINTLDYEEEGKIKSKYVNQSLLLNNVITSYLEEFKFDIVEEIINNYINVLKRGSYTEEDYKKTIFYSYQIEIENKDIIKELHFKKNGLWDMTFKNCFYIDKEFFFFDQEWNTENVPIEYILYRSIFYTISLRRFIKIEEWFKKYGLEKYIELFKKLDEKMQIEIRDEKMWDFYSQNKYIDIDGTIQEINNLNIRNDAMQGAINNLKEENEKIRNEYENYKKNIEDKMSYKIYKNLKKLLGGNNGKKD